MPGVNLSDEPGARAVTTTIQCVDGRLVDYFTIQRELGSGAFAKVYLGKPINRTTLANGSARHPRALQSAASSSSALPVVPSASRLLSENFSRSLNLSNNAADGAVVPEEDSLLGLVESFAPPTKETPPPATTRATTNQLLVEPSFADLVLMSPSTVDAIATGVEAGPSPDRHSWSDPQEEKNVAPETGEDAANFSAIRASTTAASLRNLAVLNSDLALALKVTDFNAFSPEYRPRLSYRIEHEIALLDHIQTKLGRHPNLPCAYCVVREPSRVTIAMDALYGKDLFDRIAEQKRFSEAEASKLIRTVVSTLRDLHNIGVVHRDIKPENLVFVESGRDSQVIVADFGLALLLPDGCTVYHGDSIVGSASYLAPEVVTRCEYSAKADVWSLGVILYILICGNAPFNARENRAQLWEKITNAAFSFEGIAWNIASDQAKSLVSGMLTLDPKERLSIDEILEHPWLSSTASHHYSAASASSSPSSHLETYAPSPQMTLEPIDESLVASTALAPRAAVKRSASAPTVVHGGDSEDSETSSSSPPRHYRNLAQRTTRREDPLPDEVGESRLLNFSVHLTTSASSIGSSASTSARVGASASGDAAPRAQQRPTRLPPSEPPGYPTTSVAQYLAETAREESVASATARRVAGPPTAEGTLESLPAEPSSNSNGPTAESNPPVFSVGAPNGGFGQIPRSTSAPRLNKMRSLPAAPGGAPSGYSSAGNPPSPSLLTPTGARSRRRSRQNYELPVEQLRVFNDNRKRAAAAVAVVAGAKVGIKRRLADIIDKGDIPWARFFSIPRLESIRAAFDRHAPLSENYKNDGRIDRPRFIAALKETGVVDAQATVDSIFRLFDRTGAGNVSYVALLCHLASFNPLNEASLKFCFDTIDRDHDGVISSNDVATLIRNFLSGRTQEGDEASVTDFFMRVDVMAHQDGGDQVRWAEFSRNILDPQLSAVFGRGLD